ncbi:MAG: serine/threonine-protein phosphatase [Gammaproteobacteria bacterium]|nr:serine/threonine-protein phosphatase [Gammaproteobacteria bacterium]
MLYKTASLSLQGDRKYNQDRLAVVTTPESVLLILADGMGGRSGGALASQMMVDVASELLHNELRPIVQTRQFFLEAINTAHMAMINLTIEKGLDHIPGTTCVMALIQQDRICWAHAGDSRLYFIRQGDLLTRTRDHSYVEYLMHKQQLDEASARIHPERNRITRCVGYRREMPQIEFSDTLLLAQGDELLLATDGFWGTLSDAAICQQLQQGVDLQLSLDLLAETAQMQCRPNCDNLSAILMRIDAVAPIPAVREEKLKGSQLRNSDVRTALDNIYAVIKTYEKEIKDRPKS